MEKPMVIFFSPPAPVAGALPLAAAAASGEQAARQDQGRETEPRHEDSPVVCAAMERPDADRFAAYARAGRASTAAG